MYHEVLNPKRNLYKPVTDVPLDIISVGHLIPIDENASVNRPNGTPSYMLIYIKSGRGGFFKFGNRQYFAKMGDIVIYRPDEPQEFTYVKSDITHNYWIHFAGTSAKSMMEKLELENIHIIHMPNAPIAETVEEMMKEINKNSPFSNEINVGSLYKMLSKIAQFNASKKKIPKIEEIIEEIRLNYIEDTTNAEYAHRCGLSVPHFLRLFKQETGTTPINFKLNLRIEDAQEIFETTNTSVSEVSKIVGFNDQFYFSRYFKKITGYSPSEYRKNMRMT